MRCSTIPAPLDVDDCTEKVSIPSSGLSTPGWHVPGPTHAEVKRSVSPVSLSSEKEAETAWRMQVPPLRRSLRRLYAPLRWTELGLMVPGIVLALACGAIPISMSYVLGRAFRALGEYDSSRVDASAVLLDTMRDDCVGLVGLAGAALLLRALDTYVWLVIGERGARAWRSSIVAAIVRKDVSWFDLGMSLESDTGAAGLLTMYASETDDVRLAMGIHVGGMARHLATMLLSTVYSLTRQWKLTLVIYATLPLVVIITAVGDAMAAPLEARTRQQTRELSTLVEKCLSAIQLIKAYTWERAQMDALTACAAVYRRWHSRWTLVLGVRLGLGAAVSLLTFLQGFGYGMVLVRHGEADAADVLSTFLACLVAMSQLQTILQRLAALERGVGAASRLERLRLSCVTTSRIAPAPQPLPTVQGRLSLQRVSLSYPARPDVRVLRDVSMKLEGTTYLVGPSGSGKSSIAAVVARLYDPVEGRVLIDGVDIRACAAYRAHVVCVRQEPLILERSLRENLAPHPVAPERLEAVCAAMQLTSVVRALPHGLDTMLGTRGVSLSGGQQQRVALARALMLDAPVLVLDEATSALDHATALSIHAAIKAWRQDQTTIIITHDLSLVAPDEYVHVMSDGRVVEHGPMRSLSYAPISYEARPPSYVARAPPAALLDEKAEAIDDAPVRPLSLPHALGWMWRTLPSRVWFCAALLLCVVSGITVPAFSLCLTQVLVAVAQHAPLAGGLLGATAGLAVADGLCKGARLVVMDMLATHWMQRVRLHAMRMLLAQDCTFYDKEAPSTLTAHIVKEADDARLLVSEMVGQGAVLLAMGLGALVWSIVRGWHLTLCACALLLVGVVAQGVHGAWLARREGAAMHARTTAAERVYDYVRQQRAVRAMGLDALLETEALSAAERAYVAGLRTATAVACGAGLGDAIMYTAEAVLYALGTVLLTLGTYDVRRVLDVLSPLVFTLAYAASAASVMPVAGQCLPALGRVRRLAMLREEAASDWHGTETPELAWGHVSLEHVSFSYGAAPLLTDVSLHVTPGEKIALVGRSGSGKTTLLALLQRLYEPQQGSVYMDHHRLAAMDSAHLRSSLAVVAQHPTLFPATVADNIAAGRPIAHDALVLAAQQACAHAFIEALPAQYATRLGTSTSLSGGQAQRIEWARAFARRACLWLLDEPTSALDHATRDQILSHLRATDSTAVVVTHDVHVMQQCDRVVVLEAGRIVAAGPWRTLQTHAALQRVLQPGG